LLTRAVLLVEIVAREIEMVHGRAALEGMRALPS
jgi:hypothetical protein